MTFTDLDYVEQQARKGASSIPPSVTLALVQRIRTAEAKGEALSKLVEALQARDTEPPHPQAGNGLGCSPSVADMAAGQAQDPRPVLENPEDLFKPGAPLRLSLPETEACNCEHSLELQARVLELESFRARAEALLRQLGLLHNLDVGGPYGPSTPASRRI